MNKLKLFVLFSIFCLALVMPLSYAAGNDTLTAADGAVPLAYAESDDLLTGNSYYFNASLENDSGDGSIDNPYRDLKNSRMHDGSTLYLADGVYELDTFRSLSDLTIIGSNASNTIVKFNRYQLALQSSGSLTLQNVTFVGFPIKTYGKLQATNVFFNDTHYQGAIISSTRNSQVTLENCTFSNNYASSGAAVNMDGGNLNISNSRFISNSASNGGAIYISGGHLTIVDSIFSANLADLYGGSIFCRNDVRSIINRTKFSNGHGGDVAGGIYLIESELDADYLEFTNMSANFGGAVASLKSTLKLNNTIASNNRATYEGGAVFAMYRELVISNSTLANNSAIEGGAFYASLVDSLLVRSNVFISNTQNAVSSIGSDAYYDSILDARLNNTFINNAVFESDIPDLFIGSGNYSMAKYNSSYAGSLPASFDLRDYGYVTPVKNQGKGGNCWAFSIIGALESCVLKATGVPLDLSEDNMKNLMAFYSDYGWAMDTNTGGYDRMGIGYLTGWLGPVNESSDLYSDSSVLSPVLNSIFHIQNILFLQRTSYTDNDAIKRAIMDYGAVSTSIYWDGQYLKDKSYYNNQVTSANHAIVIVGWDDTYSRQNFKNTPAGDGAWIIKNSWGTSEGDNGFYYVSYYDIRCAQLNNPKATFTFILNDTMRYDRNYQYDIPGYTDFFLNHSSTVWYKTRFTSIGEEYLAAVSTYFEKNTKWQMSIYVNDNLRLTKDGFSSPGYWTIDLGQLIHLSQGDVFEIVFKISVDGDAGVPISEDISLNYELYSKNISYVSYDGRNWVDFYNLKGSYPDHTYYSQVACIKAFTIFNKLDTRLMLRIVNDYNPVEIEARVIDEYGNPVNSGSVIFVLENTSVKVDVENGVAKLRYAFKKLDANLITAIFTGEGYNGNSSSISTGAKEVFLTADDLTCYAAHVRYSASLRDSDANPVCGKEIRFTIGNAVYRAFTNQNGTASVDLTLAAGTYNIEIDLADDSPSKYLDLSRRITVLTTVTLDTNTRFTYNSYYCARLLDENGNPLANKRVNVIIGSKTYSATTDSQGRLNYNLRLSVGTYALGVVNVETGESKSHSIRVVARLSGNTGVTTYYGANRYYKVRAFDDYGNVAKGVAVVFYFNGKYYTRYTDSNGYASFKLSGQPKTYTITATYKGFKVSNRIVIKPTVIMHDKTVKKNKLFKYSVRLLNSQGKILKYKKATLKFRGVTYRLNTNAYGIATFTLKSYSIVGRFLVVATYGTAKSTAIITVTR